MDPDPDPSIFITDIQDAKKNYFLKKVFLYITFLRYLYIIFKDKKSKRCHKTAEIKIFLLNFLNDRRIRIREAQKHVDPVDPDSDPEHCGLGIRYRTVPKYVDCRGALPVSK
jgi:hypothetical protein